MEKWKVGRMEKFHAKKRQSKQRDWIDGRMEKWKIEK
jgi:hypothetical protein